MKRILKQTKVPWVFTLIVIFTVVGVALLLANYSKDSSRSELENYLKNSELRVQSETINGYQQVYYVYKGIKIYITSGQQNHIQPVSSDRYVVWIEEVNGAGQIILYNILDKARLQISLIGTNLNPSINGKHVAWEVIQGQSRQIFYFDGLRVKKISSDFSAIRPFVEGDKVLFAQQVNVDKDIWQTILYDNITGKSKVVAEGTASHASWPRFEGNEIKTGLEGSAQYY